VPNVARPAVLFLGLVAAVAVLPALAQPQIPSSFYGSVTIDGQPAPDDVAVRAFIDGIDCTQAPPGESLAAREGGVTIYVLHVVHESQRPGCGREGKAVTFTIAGQPASQQAVWRPGPQQADLSTGAGPVVPLPSATAPPAAAPSQPAGAASSTVLARPTGTPPTDDIQLPGTLTPGATPTTLPAPPGAVDGGSAWGMLAVAVGIIAAAGIGGGIILARRRPDRDSAP